MTYRKKRIVSIWLILFICLNFISIKKVGAEGSDKIYMNKNYVKAVNQKRLFLRDSRDRKEEGPLKLEFKDKKVYVKEEDHSGLNVKKANSLSPLGEKDMETRKSDFTGFLEVKSISLSEDIASEENICLVSNFIRKKSEIIETKNWPMVAMSRTGKSLDTEDIEDENQPDESKKDWTTTLHIHKLYYEDEDLFNKHNSQPQGHKENGQLYEYIENNQVRYGHLDEDKNLVSEGGTSIGIEKGDFEKYFKGAEKLAGAYFEIRNNDKKDKENYNKIVASGYTDENGVLSLDLGPGNYRIDENLEKSDYRRISDGRRIEGAYRQKALPILLDLPVLDLPVLNSYVKDKVKGYIKDIYLYPKNTVIKPLIEKKLVYKWNEDTFFDRKSNDFEVGEDIYWQIDLRLPVKTSYQALKILDLASKGIDLKGVEKVGFQGKSMDENFYKLKEKDRVDSYYIDQIYPDKKLEDYYQNRKIYDFEITDQGLDKINTSLAQDLDDVRISLIVKGNLNGDFYIERQEKSPDLFNRNMAILDYQVVDNYQVLDYDFSEVRTGGRQFIKKNTLGENLEGAEFLILKKNHRDYEYLTIKSNQFISWTKDPAQASVFISGEDGVLRTKLDYADRLLKGLKDGRYYLEEIRPPEGYGKLVNLKEFLITRNSFYGLESMEIINTRLVLPETGAMGSLIFVGLGLLLIGLGYRLKNRKKR